MKHAVQIGGWILACWLASNAPVQACNVPVFRYALERWRPDRYELVLFHQGPLTPAQHAALAPLWEQQDKELANLALRIVDTSQPLDEPERQLLDSQSNPTFPWLVAQYPKQLRIPMPVWSGPLDDMGAKLLVESPARKELIRRLVAGETAVWLLLESGQKERDDAAATVLQTELKRLETELELPQLADTPEDALAAATPLRVAFSVLRLPRGENERALIQSLLNSEPDLPGRTDPMAFPVFGRGRALFGLVGAGITAENIHGSAAFLVGPCSCQVKELNPGFDLLLAADWPTLLSVDPSVAQANDASAPGTPTEAVLVPIPAGSSPPESAIQVATQTTSAVTGANRSLLMVAGSVVVCVLAIVCTIAGRRG